MANTANPFTVAEQRYRELLYQLHNGEITQEAFDAAQAACMVQDAFGRKWFPAPEQGRWLLWDGQQWAPYIQPAAPAQAAARLPASQPPAGRKKKGKGCLITVLALVGLLLIVGGYIIWRSPLAVRWGLRPSAAEELLGEPDRDVATELALELQLERDTPGVFYYMLPVTGTSDVLLYIVADASLGFDGVAQVSGKSEDALLNYLVQVARSSTVTSAGITQLALEYHGDDGEELGMLTARTADILAFGNGEMSREELMAVMEGRVNITRLMEAEQP